ncbi:MAG: hypothetical protein ACLU99_07665 [Alphaproteobacteria bacterium]
MPPQNKVTGDEVKNCGAYLTAEIASMPNLRAVLTLGSVAHNAVLSVLGYKNQHSSLPTTAYIVWIAITYGW